MAEEETDRKAEEETEKKIKAFLKRSVTFSLEPGHSSLVEILAERNIVKNCFLAWGDDILARKEALENDGLDDAEDGENIGKSSNRRRSTHSRRRSSFMVMGQQSSLKDKTGMTKEERLIEIGQRMPSKQFMKVMRCSGIAGNLMADLNSAARLSYDAGARPFSAGTQGEGFFSDMTLRANVKVNAKAAHFEKGSRQRDAIEGFNMELMRALDGDPEILERIPEYKLARSVIVRENLHAKLMGLITLELKTRGVDDGGWAPTPANKLPVILKKLSKQKKDVVLIGTEVENRLVTYRLINHKVFDSKETARERQYRMEEFWAEFHDRAREPGPHIPRHMTDLGVKTPPLTNETWRLTRTGAGPVPEIQEICEERMALKPTRRKEERPRYGMTWDVDGKPILDWGITNPAVGSRRRSQLELPNIVEDTRVGAQIRSMGSKSASLPSLRGSKRVPSKLQSQESVNEKMSRFPALVDATRTRYFRHCEDKGKIPLSLPFVTGHLEHFDAHGRNLVDSDLIAICSMLPEAATINMISLADNALLSDKSVPNFIRRLMREPLASATRELYLNGCKRIGVCTLDECTKFIQLAKNLREVSLSGIEIASRFQLPLCSALGKHPSMKEVHLSSIRLDTNAVSKPCCESLLASRSITLLDLSWNSFDSQVFTTIGECIERNRTLKVLNLESTTALTGRFGNDAPISFFLEKLSRNQYLHRLDLSANFIDFRAALVLEDALQCHQTLAKLDLDNNPLGVGGMRCVIRVLCFSSSGLMEIETNCCHQGDDGVQVGQEPKYSATNPSGSYTLNLVRPYHRAILRKLYKCCGRFGLYPDQAFFNVVYNVGDKKQPYVHPPKGDDGLFEVPAEGILKFVFNNERAIEQALAGIEDSDFFGFLTRYFDFTKLQPSFKKIIPIFFNWYRIQTNVDEQRCFVNAMSKDFNLKLPWLEYMVSCCKAFASEAIERLLACMPMDDWSRYCTMLMFPRISEFVAAHKTMMKLLDFNVMNPTGHYRLDLSKCTEYAVADQLKLIDRWEAAVDRRLERFDVSQRGNKCHFRNECYQGRALHVICNSMAEWTLPECDIVEFDYMSSARPALPCKNVLSDETYDRLLVTLYESDAHLDDKVQTLRKISDLFFITSMQMRTLLGNFESEEQRGEAFIIFFLRIVDIENAKLFTVRFTKEEEVVKLRERLGYAAFFPFFQPENNKFALRFECWDQRVCLSILVKISLLEKAGNIRDPVYVRADGTIDPLPLGVPRSWEDRNKLPPEGFFSCTYVCSPDDRRFDVRKKLSHEYSFFESIALEEEVNWWTGLQEAPMDVIDFLEFIQGRFSSSEEAFKFIDGPGGNGVITLREFEEGFRDMECQKFKGKDELSRIHTVFRYLDPGGEGSVSFGEWGAMTQLWKEFELSVREFVHFLVRSFGPELHVAWEFLDSDDSGELTEEEWITAVTNIGYFGPAAVVFALLDNSDDGNISLDEFEVLEKYLPDHAKAELARRAVAAGLA